MVLLCYVEAELWIVGDREKLFWPSGKLRRLAWKADRRTLVVILFGSPFYRYTVKMWLMDTDCVVTLRSTVNKNGKMVYVAVHLSDRNTQYVLVVLAVFHKERGRLVPARYIRRRLDVKAIPVVDNTTIQRLNPSPIPAPSVSICLSLSVSIRPPPPPLFWRPR